MAVASMDFRPPGRDFEVPLGSDWSLAVAVRRARYDAVDGALVVVGYDPVDMSAAVANIYGSGTSIATAVTVTAGATDDVVVLSLTAAQLATLSGSRIALFVQPGGTQILGGRFTTWPPGTPGATSSGSLTLTLAANTVEVTTMAATVAAPDVLAALKTVDGAGSGLDADLLDGQHGAHYAVAADLVAEAASRAAADAALDGRLDVLEDDPTTATAVAAVAAGVAALDGRLDVLEDDPTTATAVAAVAANIADHEAETAGAHGIPDPTTILVDGDVGSTVQAHSAVLDATTAPFTAAEATKVGYLTVTGATGDLANARTDIDAKLPKAGGTMTGDLTVLKGSGNVLAEVKATGTSAASEVVVTSTAGGANVKVQGSSSARLYFNDGAGAARVMVVVDGSNMTWYEGNFGSQILSYNFASNLVSVASTSGLVLPASAPAVNGAMRLTAVDPATGRIAINGREFGDTGWRTVLSWTAGVQDASNQIGTINAANFAIAGTSQIRVRRVGQWIEWEFCPVGDNSNKLSFSATGGALFASGSVPSGFRIKAGTMAGVTSVNGPTTAINGTQGIGRSAGGADLLYAATASDCVRGSGRYLTDDAWPTSLPGTQFTAPATLS